MAPSMMKLTLVSFEDDATSIIVGASHGCAVNNGGQHQGKFRLLPTFNKVKIGRNAEFNNVFIFHSFQFV
jgi:hypothetical protein